MTHSKPATGSVKGASSGSGGGVLRDLLSTVAQQVESHLHPRSSPSSEASRHCDGNGDGQGQLAVTQRRPSRIRSWIGHDKSDKEKEKLRVNGDFNGRSDGGDNSLHFTDSSDDDFQPNSDSSLPVSRRNIEESTFKLSGPQPNCNRDGATNAAEITRTEANANATMRILTPGDANTREKETVDMLIGVMGDGFDREVARRILRKYDGNVDKAAGALLEGEQGEELFVGSNSAGAGAAAPIQIQGQGWPPISASAWSMGGTAVSTGMGSTQTPSQMPQARLDVVPSALSGRPNTPVIDLTLEDDPDVQRAMQESMNTLNSGSQSQNQAYTTSSQSQSQGQIQVQSQSEGPVFGPSNRPPDPNWAIVPSHQNENNDANYLHNLNRAIEASLETMGDSDALEPFPVEQQLRRDGCPVVLRPSLHTMVYAASILQGLFYVPQVRERMACWRPLASTSENEAALPMSDPDYTLWALSEIFTHMDLARLCDLNVDTRMFTFNVDPWDRPTQPPGELSRKFFTRLSRTLENSFVEQFARSGQPLPKPRLLHFQYGSGVSEPGELLQETSIVPIDVHGGDSNDLIGRLSAQLSNPQFERGKQCVIYEPSEVVAFELVRATPTTNTADGNGAEKKAFTYPKSIYLDQFLREKVELAQAKRDKKREIFEEVQRLVLHKKTLTHFDGKDTLKDLRSTVFYFENVANTEHDPEREACIQTTVRKLKIVLSTIEERIKTTDEQIDKLRNEAETLLDCAELQQFKYDLRVVFVHDGLYGRKHLYSYVHDKSCWWKISDSLIEKVSEELVFNDQGGLHLGAGPYLLFYSREKPGVEGPAQALPWMDEIKDDVKAANRAFLSQLPPELVGDIVIEEEELLSLPNVVSSGQRMDVS